MVPIAIYPLATTGGEAVLSVHPTKSTSISLGILERGDNGVILAVLCLDGSVCGAVGRRRFVAYVAALAARLPPPAWKDTFAHNNFSPAHETRNHPSIVFPQQRRLASDGKVLSIQQKN